MKTTNSSTASAATGGGRAEKMATEAKKSTGYDSSNSFSDTTSDTSSTGSFSSRSSTTSSASSIEDLADDLVEEGHDSSSTSANHNMQPSPPPANREPKNTGSIGTLPAFHPALGGERVDPGKPGVAATSCSTATADCLPAASKLSRSCSVMTVAADDLPKWDDVVRYVDSPPSPSSSSSSSSPSFLSSSWSGHRPPLLNHVKEQPRAAATNPSRPTPGLSTGRSFNEGVMSQEEAVSLFSATAGKPTVAATATGGVESSEDGLWNMATDEADVFLSRPTLGRLSSSSWGLDPVHAATVVANDNDDGDVNADGQKVCAASTATAVEKQPEQQPAGRVKLPPPGDTILLGWCQEVRPLMFAMIPCLHSTAFVILFRSLSPLHLPLPALSRTILPKAKKLLSPLLSPLQPFQECDFDGRSTTYPSTSRVLSSPSECTSSSSVDSQCHFTFQRPETGAKSCELRDFAVLAQFFVNPEAKVERTASLLEIDASGQAHATVSYPSIRDICPEMYKMASIKAIEVSPVRVVFVFVDCELLCWHG